MTVPSLLEEPGRVDEPQAAQEYAAVLTQVVAAGRPVIVRRNGEDLAAVVTLEHLGLVREILAHQEVERSAAEIDWTRVARPPAHRNRGSTTRTTTPSSRRRNQRREPVPVPPAAARQRRLGGAGRPQRLSQGSPGCRRHSHGGHQCREAGTRGGDHDPTPQPSAGRLRLAALGSAREGSLGLEGRCAAVASWQAEIPVGAVQQAVGILPPQAIGELLTKISAALPPRSATPAPTPPPGDPAAQPSSAPPGATLPAAGDGQGGDSSGQSA